LIRVKGKGKMKTYWLIGKKQPIVQQGSSWDWLISLGLASNHR
jgi:hypothetical protein